MATIFALSCESENNNVVVQDLPEDYFPLRKGVFQIYDMHKVEYTLGVASERDYQLKTLLVDSIDRGNGTYSYVQYNYERESSGKDWVYVGTWAVQADERELIVNEANTSYLKYKFPLAKGYTWNGNAYNGMEADEYVMEDVKISQSIGGNSYTDCLVVNQSDNQDFVVFLDQRKEIYARNIGLVSKEVRQLHYCTDSNSGCLGQQVVEEGEEYTQTLITHGQE
ncbi:MAG: hypothetical protein QM762_21185 [Chryseolinea sp.]